MRACGNGDDCPYAYEDFNDLTTDECAAKCVGLCTTFSTEHFTRPTVHTVCRCVHIFFFPPNFLFTFSLSLSHTHSSSFLFSLTVVVTRICTRGRCATWASGSGRAHGLYEKRYSVVEHGRMLVGVDFEGERTFFSLLYD